MATTFLSSSSVMVAVILLFFSSLLACCGGWILPSLSSPKTARSFPTTTSLFVSSSSSSSSAAGGAQEDDAERMRMAAIRSLQTAFYDVYDMKTKLNDDTGIVSNLPLWRVPWVELPGRTNVLNVHDPMYTNMFESVLHSEPPWYVGHMYHFKEEDSSLSEDNNNLVTAWDDDSDDNEQAGGKVLGTILRIVDYRRFEDGRLLLLVQGMERFTVVDVVQQLPYGVANVQLIPDLEEVDYDDGDWTTKRTESDVSAARGLAISDSFNKWYRYEYENTLLPLPLKEEIKTEDVVGGAIAKVLPYAPYSSVVKVEQVLREEDDDDDESDISRLAIEANRSNNRKQNNTTLEYRLIQSDVLCEPPTTRLYQKLSCDELEIRLWLAINDHLKKTKKAVSPVLLGFLPHNVDWDSAVVAGGRAKGGGAGSGFLLEQIARTLEAQTQLESKFVRMPPEYPALRRQKRFSYSVAALLEEIDTVNDFRRVLLSIPSTKGRMAFILQMLEPEELKAYDDDDEWGVFQ